MHSYRLTAAQWRNLLPAIPSKLLVRRHSTRPNEYFLTGTKEDHEDAMRRCAMI